MDFDLAAQVEAQQEVFAEKLPELDLAKNELQCYFQTRHGPRVVPEYVLDRNDASGFFVSLDISKIDDGRGIVGRGVAAKKKDAEKLAALDALAKLQEQGGFPMATEEPVGFGMNPKTKLNEVFHSVWRTSPAYTFHTDPATGHFTAELCVGNKVFRATGLSKAKASADVAEKALRYITDSQLLPRF
jgi:dsRNA-specific ribonuclease